MIGYIAFALAVIGLFYIGVPKLRGQYILFASQILMMIHGIRELSIFLFVAGLLLSIITVQSIHQWTMKDVEF